MTVAFAFRDFMENDTGLEYIGERNQQMGDGGAIAQSRMQTAMFGCDGCKLAVSDRNMRQLMSCGGSTIRRSVSGLVRPKPVVPADWTSVDFDDSD
jgi:hypothetical protein